MDKIVHTFSFPDGPSCAEAMKSGLDVKGPLNHGYVNVYVNGDEVFRAYNNGLANGDTLHIDFSEVDDRVFQALQ